MPARTRSVLQLKLVQNKLVPTLGGILDSLNYEQT
jgi:hypothetical protein